MEISSTGTTAEITFVAFIYDVGLMIVTMEIMMMIITMI